MTETAATFFARGEELRLERRYADAVEPYRAAAEVRDGSLGRKQRRVAFALAVKCATRGGAWAAGEAIARRGIDEFPTIPFLHQGLGESLIRLGQLQEAEGVLRRALQLFPELDGAQALLATLKTVAVGKPKPARGFPTLTSMLDDPRAAVRRYLLRSRPKDPFIRPDTTFLTLGSCFAQNLAERLREVGYAAQSEEIGEDVNSTYANRYLLDWIENGPTDDLTLAIDSAYGPASRERLRRAFASSQVFVMTLGVAAAFFDAEGRFVFVPQHGRTAADILVRQEMRTTTVAENVENIGRILDAARRLGGREMKIVLTVSPVPIAGTTEMESAITADCLSKSTLRVACHEVVTARAGQGVIYWPSFEIVRWLAPHLGPSVPRVYGADDGNARHVSRWLVDLIVAEFLEFHAAANA